MSQGVIRYMPNGEPEQDASGFVVTRPSWPDYASFVADGVEEDIRVREVRTKQGFKDSADINKILKKAQTVGALSHLQKYPAAVYGVFQNYDLLEAHRLTDYAREVFGALPSEVRDEFDGDAFAFAAFASDPSNNARLQELLPAIARPGRHFPNPVNRGGQGAGAATAPAREPAVDPEPTSSSSDSSASGADASSGT